jgi:hypothetical protein
MTLNPIDSSRWRVTTAAAFMRGLSVTWSTTPFCRRSSRRRLVARDVVGVPQVDDLLAGLPFVSREFEWSGADDLLDLLFRKRGRNSRRHHEGHVARRLSQRVKDGPKGSASSRVKCFPVDGRDLARMCHQELAKASLFPQRFSDSTQSSDRTGFPSCH